MDIHINLQGVCQSKYGQIDTRHVHIHMDIIQVGRVLVRLCHVRLCYMRVRYEEMTRGRVC